MAGIIRKYRKLCPCGNLLGSTGYSLVTSYTTRNNPDHVCINCSLDIPPGALSSLFLTQLRQEINLTRRDIRFT